MSILFDTNIVLDVLLDRKPFVHDSELLFSYVESGKITGFLAATTITTIYYLANKVVGAAPAKTEISKLVKLFEIAPINRMVLEDAILLGFPDFEDAVLHESARHIGATAIVTRNHKDFQKATLSVYSPSELLKLLR